jgi:aarF domain-containing kinase
MSGKTLLDIVALFNASRGVAQKHIALRGRQLDVYNRTSSLARAVRNQTDRITETAKAASFLASRLNESAPTWTADAPHEKSVAKSKDGETVSRKDTAGGKASPPEGNEGLKQDHSYERSQSNDVLDPKPNEDLEIHQETAARYPLPDGTIPPAESDLKRPDVDHYTVSIRSTDGPLRRPLEEHGLKPVSSGASSIPSPTSRNLSSDEARRRQRQSEKQTPSKTADALGAITPDPLEDGHDEDSFYKISGHTSPTLSSMPRFKIPKHPSSTQDGDAEGLNSNTFYNSRESQRSEQTPSAEAVTDQEQIPEGVNTDLFYSPRIARLLGGKTNGAKDKDLKLEGSKSRPVERTGLAHDMDQSASNTWTSSQQVSPSSDIDLHQIPATFDKSTDTKEEIEILAQDLAMKSNDQSSQVRHSMKSDNWQ